MDDDDDEMQGGAAAMEGLRRALDKCRMNTMYARGMSALVAADKIRNVLLETVLRHVGPLPNAVNRNQLLAEMTSVQWIEAKSCDAIQARCVCPGSVLRAAKPSGERAIYDVDGLEHLVAVLVDSNAALSAGPSHFCRQTLTRFTCSPAAAISLLAVEQCFVPTALEPQAKESYWTMKWDILREAEIASSFRSVLFCGPTIEAMLTTRRSTGLYYDVQQMQEAFKRSAQSAAAAAAASSPVLNSDLAATPVSETTVGEMKKPKPPNIKWNGALLGQSLAFLDGSDNEMETESSSSHQSDSSYSSQDTEEEKEEEEEEAAAPRPKHEVEPMDMADLAHELDNLLGAGAAIVGDSDPALVSGAGTAAAVGAHTAAAVLSSKSIPGLGNAEVASIVRSALMDAANAEPTRYVPTDYGNPSYRSVRYDLVTNAGAQVQQQQQQQEQQSMPAQTGTAAAAENWLLSWVRHQGGLTSAMNTRTNPWLDMVLAEKVGDVMEEVFPCSCICEFVARLFSDYRVELARRELQIVCNADETPQADCSAAVLSTAVKIATGTLCEATAAEPSFRHFVKDFQEVFYSGSSCVIHHTAVCNNATFEDGRDTVVRMWANAVGAKKEQLLEPSSSARRQQWYFARVTGTVGVGEALERLVVGEKNFCRAGDMLSAALRMLLENGDAPPPSVILFAPGETWMCDVCWAFSMAQHVVDTNPLVAGIPFCCGDRTVMALVPSADADAFLCGSMISLMRENLVFDNHYSIYPFVAAVLEWGNVNEMRPLYHAAVGWLSDVCLREWNRLSGKAHQLPWYGDDHEGAPSAEMAKGHEKHRMLHAHESLALSMLPAVWKLFCRAVRDLEGGGSGGGAETLKTEQYLRGLVCITRPFRLWTVSSGAVVRLWSTAEYDPLLQSILSDPKNLGRDNRIRIRGRDLCEQVAANIKLLSHEDLVPHLALALPKAEAAAGVTEAIDIWPIQRDFTGDGSVYYSRQHLAVDRPLEPPKKCEGNVTSCTNWVARLQSEIVNDVEPQRALNLNCAFAFLHRLEAIKGHSASAPPPSPPLTDAVFVERARQGLPLIYTCDNELLTSRDCLPVADNPMALPMSRPMLCPKCGAEVPKPLLRTHIDSPLLPKNSELLSELMHYRHGLCVMPFAWPTRAILSAYEPFHRSRNSPAFVKEYSTQVVRSLCSASDSLDLKKENDLVFSFSSKSKALQQQQQQHEDENMLVPPEDIEEIMMQMEAQDRAELAVKHYEDSHKN